VALASFFGNLRKEAELVLPENFTKRVQTIHKRIKHASEEMREKTNDISKNISHTLTKEKELARQKMRNWTEKIEQGMDYHQNSPGMQKKSGLQIKNSSSGHVAHDAGNADVDGKINHANTTTNSSTGGVEENTPRGPPSSFKMLLISLALLSAIGACMCTVGACMCAAFDLSQRSGENSVGGERFARDGGESDREDLADHKPLVRWS